MFLLEIVRYTKHPFQFVTSTELFVWHLFIACLCVATGFSVFTSIILAGNPTIRLRDFLEVQKDQWFIPPTFYLLMTKITGLVLLGSYWYYQLFVGELFEEILLIGILAPVVIFLQQWNTIRRRFEGATTKLMLKVIFVEVLFAIVLASVRGHDFSTMEAQAIQRTPSAVLQLELPKAISSAHAHTDLENDVYIGRTRSNGSVVIAQGYFRSEWIPLDTLVQRRMRARDDLYNPSAKRGVVVISDKNLPMTEITPVISSLRKIGDMNFLFQVNDLYGSEYLAIRIGHECSYSNPIVDSECVSNNHSARLKKVRFDQSGAWVNDTLHTKDEMKEWMAGLMEESRDSPFYIALTFGSDLTYGAFIQHYEPLAAAVYETTRRRLKDEFPNVSQFEWIYRVPSQVHQQANRFQPTFLILDADTSLVEQEK